ncbi:hypothetical protein [Spongiactinospora gelatinilytica]|uniref:hypothetical protein n=1 Tax=Spongiactinospora gelatinilytica TaxID=2666298 RepID=UPI00131455DF|nr:hypothetical protein [Spongiactinospora gelatinilytica]
MTVEAGLLAEAKLRFEVDGKIANTTLDLPEGATRRRSRPARHRPGPAPTCPSRSASS